MNITQALLGHHLQHPVGPGAVLYPGQGSAWQPVVTSLPSLADIPKESIIANTDFTTTSVIAKRRLSSKKRKKLESQNQRLSCDGSVGTSSSEQHTTTSSTCSPMESSGSGSPAITSTTCTPPPAATTEKSNQTQDEQFVRPSVVVTTSCQSNSTSSSQSHTLTTSQSHQPHTHTSSQHHIPHTVHQLQPVVSGSGQFTGYSQPTTVPHPVLSQLQQELNIRFLQERGGMLVAGGPHGGATLTLSVGQRDESKEEVSDNSGRKHHKLTGFKWCYAHVAIAKQIQLQQQKEKAHSASASSESTCMSSTSSHMTSHLKQSQADASAVATTTTATMTTNPPVEYAAVHHHQQQQLALLQMYGLPTVTTAATGGAGSSAPVPGGYMAVPYTSLPEVQLRMHQLAAAPHTMAPLQLQNIGVALATGPSQHPQATTQEAATALFGHNLINPSGLPMVSGLHLQHAAAAATAGHPYPGAHTAVPLATIAPTNLNNATMFHSTASGQWMAPVPMVGSCIVNPFQPGIMAAPWVK